MGTQTTSPYEQLIERTKALSFRSQMLQLNVEKKKKAQDQPNWGTDGFWVTNNYRVIKCLWNSWLKEMYVKLNIVFANANVTKVKMNLINLYKYIYDWFSWQWTEK